MIKTTFIVIALSAVLYMYFREIGYLISKRGKKDE